MCLPASNKIGQIKRSQWNSNTRKEAQTSRELILDNSVAYLVKNRNLILELFLYNHPRLSKFFSATWDYPELEISDNYTWNFIQCYQQELTCHNFDTFLARVKTFFKKIILSLVKNKKVFPYFDFYPFILFTSNNKSVCTVKETFSLTFKKMGFSYIAWHSGFFSLRFSVRIKYKNCGLKWLSFTVRDQFSHGKHFNIEKWQKLKEDP